MNTMLKCTSGAGLSMCESRTKSVDRILQAGDQIRIRRQDLVGQLRESEIAL